jgi:hypothetical protein
VLPKQVRYHCATPRRFLISATAPAAEKASYNLACFVLVDSLSSRPILRLRGEVGPEVMVGPARTKPVAAAFVLAPGAYFLATGTGAPEGSRAVGSLTVSPLAGKPLPIVTLGQRYGGESKAIFLTQSGTLQVATDGSTTIRTDLIDQQATQQISDHPLISGTWRCAA